MDSAVIDRSFLRMSHIRKTSENNKLSSQTKIQSKKIKIKSRAISNYSKKEDISNKAYYKDEKCFVIT